MENRRPNVCPTFHLPPQSVRFVVETQKRRMDAIGTAGEGSAYHHTTLPPFMAKASSQPSQRQTVTASLPPPSLFSVRCSCACFETVMFCFESLFCAGDQTDHAWEGDTESEWMHFKNGLKNETVKTSRSGLIGIRRNPTTHFVFSLCFENANGFNCSRWLWKRWNDSNTKQHGYKRRHLLYNVFMCKCHRMFS